MVRKLLAAAVVVAALAGCAALPERVQEAFGVEGNPRLSAFAMVAVVSELAADRVVRSEPGDAMPTYARLLRLVGALQAYDQGSEHWPEAATHDARREVAIALGEILDARAGSLIQINGRLDIGLDLVMTEIDRAGKAAAMRRDILALTGSVAAGAMLEDEAAAVLMNRIARNLKRVEALGSVR